jgi:hypothetical protein
LPVLLFIILLAFPLSVVAKKSLVVDLFEAVHRLIVEVGKTDSQFLNRSPLLSMEPPSSEVEKCLEDIESTEGLRVAEDA